MGLIGCGAVLLLVVVLVFAWTRWWNRNREDVESAAGAAAREGARYGLAHDEQACFDEGARRAALSRDITGGFAVGAFTRACLEYSRESPLFCENVPPVTAVRRSVEWQQQRCGTDVPCTNAAQVVQGYCTDGRPKRAAADTLLLMRGDSAPASPRAPPADTVQADSGSF